MKFNVCAVIVTYGNRFHLLKQVVDSALAEGVMKAIVVDNNSVPESREKLKEYEKELGSNKIRVLYLDDNYGSAGGYKRGLQEAYSDPECEFIWLLDDDNKPLYDSLNTLIRSWQRIQINNKKGPIALVSFRPDQLLNLDEIEIISYKNSIKKINSFLGYSLSNLIFKIIKKLISKIYDSNKIKLKKQYISYIKNGKELVNVKYSYYGGMFFNKKLLNLIGYPDESFFVYVDDTEWSYRIVKMRGKIFLCLNSKIAELEKSFYIQNSRFKYDTFRLYYSIRNAVYFEKNNFVNNVLIYYINMILFKTLLLIFALVSGRFVMYTITSKAINDGLKGNMGKTWNNVK